MYGNLNMNFQLLLNNNYLHCGQIISEDTCQKLYKEIQGSRKWLSRLFRTEEKVNIQLFPKKIQNNPNSETNRKKCK